MESEITSATDWQGTRSFPETYPGRVPEHDYLLRDGRVLPLCAEDPADPLSLHVFDEVGRWQPLDGFLRDHGLPGLGERQVVVSYGANRNPASLWQKFDHHGYRSPGDAAVLPVLRASLPGAEAVAATFGGRGYVFADLVIGVPEVVADQLEVWINLADDDALRMLHDSERVDTDNGYEVAVVDGVAPVGFDVELRALAYVTSMPTLTLPGDDGSSAAPVAFRDVGASGRRIRAVDQVELLTGVMADHDLVGELCRLSGLDAGPGLALELMRFVNEGWWQQRDGGQRSPRCREVLRALYRHIADTAEHFETAERLRTEGRVLTTEQAYNPESTTTYSA